MIEGNFVRRQLVRVIVLFNILLIEMNGGQARETTPLWEKLFDYKIYPRCRNVCM